MIEPAPHSPQPMKRTRIFAVAIVLILVACLVALGVYLASRPQHTQLQGMVDTESINVTTKLPSRVRTLLVKEGDPVTFGEPLAILASPELDAKSAQAAGALESAQALAQRTDSGSREEDIATLRAAWQAALAQQTLAEQTAGRIERLYAEGVVAAQRRDEAVAARTSAREHSVLTQSQYRRALAGNRSEDKTIAAAQVKMAEAGVHETQALQAETRLFAPVAGEVAKRFANPGELVLPGVPVYTVIDLHDLWVSINVRESDFHGLKMGAVLHGSIPALDVADAAFKVSFISPQGDFATWRATRQSSGYDVRSFEVRLRPEDAIPGLRPGMSVLFDWPQSAS